MYLNQLEDILDGLNSNTAQKDWSYIGVGPLDGKKAGEFVPILYRNETYTLLEFTNIWLSETPDRPSKGEELSSHCPFPCQLKLFYSLHICTQVSKSRLGCTKLEPDSYNRRV